MVCMAGEATRRSPAEHGPELFISSEARTVTIHEYRRDWSIGPSEWSGPHVSLDHDAGCVATTPILQIRLQPRQPPDSLGGKHPCRRSLAVSDSDPSVRLSPPSRSRRS